MSESRTPEAILSAEVIGDGFGIALPPLTDDETPRSDEATGVDAFMVCGYECECGFKLSGAREYEMEWIAQEHRALIHGDES